MLGWLLVLAVMRWRTTVRRRGFVVAAGVMAVFVFAWSAWYITNSLTPNWPVALVLCVPGTAGGLLAPDEGRARFKGFLQD